MPGDSALKRFKSRITRSRRHRHELPSGAGSGAGSGVGSGSDTVTTTPPHPREVVEEHYEAFADMLQDILDVQASVYRVQTSLKTAGNLSRRMTASLKETSGGRTSSTDAVCLLDLGRVPDQRLDAVRGNILVGTMEGLGRAADCLDDLGRWTSAGVSSAGVSSLELEELRELLVDAILRKLRTLSLEADVRQAAGLLGRVAGPPAELRCLLEYHAGVIRRRVRAMTLHHHQRSPPQLAGEVAGALTELIAGAREQALTLEGWTVLFDIWALQMTKEVWNVVQRLVVRPLVGEDLARECEARFKGGLR